MFKVCTVNVGTMKGRSREVVSMLKRRHADLCCVQEVRYKNGGSTTVGTGDEKYKLWYSGNEEGTGGVGIFLCQDLVQNLIEVVRYSDRCMKLKIVLGKSVYHILSVYAPQVGLSAEEKEAFRDSLEDIISHIPERDGLILAGDLNCHIGNIRTGYESVMGDYGFGTSNVEGIAMLDICKNQNLKISNTYFKKDREKLITYKSGEAETQLDYIIFRPKLGQNIVDCKVIPGEECLTQHRLVRADFSIEDLRKKKWRGERRLKLWKLREEGVKEEFEERIKETLCTYEGDWVQLRQGVMQVCEEICGRSSGRRGHERETWWWNDTVQDAVRKKKEAYKKWQITKLVRDKMVYRQISNETKRKVAAAKRQAWEQWSQNLQSSSGQRKMFKLAKQMKKDKADITGSNYINDESGNVQIEEGVVVERWKRYFENLLNQENACSIEDVPSVQGPILDVTEAEVEMALKSMKQGKAAGPTESTSDMFKFAGRTGVELLTKAFSQIFKTSKVPSEWAESITIPLFKGKGSALECEKYRGLRLLEHGMKVFEQILRRRLQLCLEIHQQQFGFMSGRSTTDAIFILRQLQEKYCQNKQKLYHIFVDLEKAFDKVPRRVVQWALRKALIPEYMVQLVMALYSESFSKVRFGGSTSPEFPIGVGVHQGSALSPLLFILVLEVATKECRTGDPWELLYADDLVLTGETREEVTNMFLRWKEAMECRGLKVNLGKTKIMVTGKQGENLQSGRYPCSVCGRGVGVNSILCVTCNRWCHGRCSGLPRVSGVVGFCCPRCAGQVQVAPTLDDSITIPEGVIAEVKQFCYLGDVLDSVGGAERAAKARVSIAWMRWRELSSLLCNPGIPLLHRARVYDACIRSTMLYGSETWAATRQVEDILVKCDRRMLRRMCGVRLSERVATTELLERCSLLDLEMVMTKRRLNWYGHVVRRSESEALGRVMSVVAPGRRPRGRPKKTWKQRVEEDLRIFGLSGEIATDRDQWRAIITRLTSDEGRRRR